MQVQAKIRGARLSAQKARLVADQVRGRQVEEAIDLLTYSTKKGADVIRKLLNSAIANAEHNEGADVDELKISKICRQMPLNPAILADSSVFICCNDQGRAHQTEIEALICGCGW